MAIEKIRSINIFFKQRFGLLFLSLIYLCLNSCSVKSNHYNSKLDAEAKPIVLTTFTILADLARNVAGDRLIIKSITKPGAEIHSYQFTPSDLVNAKGVDLIIENGLGLESWIKKFTSNLSNTRSVVLSNGVNPLLIDGDIYAGKPNPHAWMSPKRTMKYVDNLLQAFIILDPEGKESYIENATKYKTKLKELDIELTNALSLIPKRRKVLVTCEGAFSYLTHDYGMDEAYLWPVNAESPVTPRRMANLISLIKQRGIPTIFCESTVSSKAQLEVARASGASFGGTFYVDSLSDKNGPAATLLELQRHNVRLIQKGLMN